jgi:AcrR family transcriptional regulator
MSPRRLTDSRADELLRAAMRVIAEQGFSDLRMTDLATSLNCSTGTLYKLAPSKESLVLLALDRWTNDMLRELAQSADSQPDPLTRSRVYWSSMVSDIGQLSLAFRRDVERFEATRRHWQRTSDEFIEHFATYLEAAMQAGQIRQMHSRFLAELLRHMSAVLRDADLLASLNMSTAEALAELDGFVWDGLILQTQMEEMVT